METKIPIRPIPIAPSGLHLAVSAFINGNLANVLIDTGASQTVMDLNRIRIFSSETEFVQSGQTSKGLGTDGMESFQFTISQFILGDLELENMEVMLLDLKHVNGSYRQLGLPAIDMVLGGDLMQRYSAVIDYGRLELCLIVVEL